MFIKFRQDEASAMQPITMKKPMKFRVSLTLVSSNKNTLMAQTVKTAVTFFLGWRLPLNLFVLSMSFPRVAITSKRPKLERFKLIQFTRIASMAQYAAREAHNH
jgi:hypothetical protein